jgi:hypothetical protein
MRSMFGLALAAVLSAFAPRAAIASVSPSTTIVGTVTLTAADGSRFPGEGARVTLICPADGTTTTEVSDEHGAFRFQHVPIDRCSIQADVQGFAAQPMSVVTAADQVAACDLQLGVAQVRVGVTVGGTMALHEPKILPGACRSDTSPRPSATRCKR